jgi:polyketide biosynthesis enoyl-CoA hydratase PksH
MNNLDAALVASKPKALAANIEVFSDSSNLEKIARYVKTGQFPWEG